MPSHPTQQDHPHNTESSRPGFDPSKRLYMTPDQRRHADVELLVMLSEEAGEVVQAVSKLLRHGRFNFDPRQLHHYNVDALVDELVDFNALVQALLDAGVLKPHHEDRLKDPEVLEDVFRRKTRYMYGGLRELDEFAPTEEEIS